jgi:signal transduction histidine kinase
VEIRLAEGGGKVECAVQDTGLGISEENKPRIFGKFEQFGWVPGGGEKGMGLGLAVSKGIIELHGGRIKMESQLGQGSTFTFELPQNHG